MKKLFTLVLLFVSSIAFADPFPPAPADGYMHWQNGVRYHYNLASLSWQDPTTSWETSAEAAGFTVDSEYKDILILANGTFTIDLESAATLGDNFSFAVKNVGAGVITVDANLAETIDGNATFALGGLNQTVEFASDGTNWYIVSAYTDTIDPGTAQGQMIFWDATASKWTNTDVSELFWDDTNKRVGISTNTPVAALSIDAGVGTIDTGIGFGDGDVGIYESVDDILAFDVEGSLMTLEETLAEDTKLSVDEVHLGRSEFKDEMWGTLAGEWATRVSTGSRAPQSISNGVFRFTTGATINDEESIDWNDVCTFSNTEQPSYKWRVKLEQTANIRVRFGLIEASGAGDDDLMIIYYDSGVAATWTMRFCLGGSGCVDTAGILADTAWHVFEIQAINDTFWRFSIDGVSYGSLASQIPTVQLQPLFEVTTLENAAHYADVDLAEYRQDRE